MSSRIFYGWVIAACAMTALMISNGMLIGGINVFDESLIEEFDWSRSSLKFRDLLTFALTGLLGARIPDPGKRCQIEQGGPKANAEHAHFHEDFLPAINNRDSRGTLQSPMCERKTTP